MDPQTTVDELFGSKNNRFVVPSYQRAYSWQTDKGVNDQVGQFLRDVKEQCSSPWYSFGHFLFEKNDGAFEVIDGQQRLTTIVIFMSCLVSECGKRGLVELGGVEVEEIRETYLKHRIQKFQTVAADAAYFMNRIVECDSSALKDANRRSQQCIEDAANYFAAEMSSASYEELVRWHQVVRSAKVTTFVIDGVDAKQIATQIFSYQNDRGKSLTTLEKVKAYLMSQVYKFAQGDANVHVKTVETQFSAIYGATETVDEPEDTVLRWHCQAYVDGGAESSFDAIKRALAKAVDKVAWTISFSSQLAQTYKIVRELEDAKMLCSHGGYVADVRYLDKANVMPLLIKLSRYGVLDGPDGGVGVLECIEHILFKLVFTTESLRTNRLVSYAHEYNGDNLESWLMPTLRHAEHNGFQPYWDFNGWCLRYFAVNRYHYRSSMKYVLYKYENSLRGNETRLDASEYNAIFRESKSAENTLDHVSPQTPDYTVYSDSFRKDYLSNLGNLSLLTWSANSGKSNRVPTDVSVRERFNTSMLSQREIYKTLCGGEWGERQIDARREKIIEFIKKNWKLQD